MSGSLARSRIAACVHQRRNRSESPMTSSKQVPDPGGPLLRRSAVVRTDRAAQAATLLASRVPSKRSRTERHFAGVSRPAPRLPAF
jgi:hypothetical protein